MRAQPDACAGSQHCMQAAEVLKAYNSLDSYGENELIITWARNNQYISWCSSNTSGRGEDPVT